MTLIAEVPELPRFSASVFGEAERRKLGACTPTVIVVAAVKLPEVPVMVSAVVETGAELLAVRVSTLLPDVGFVPHAAVTPLGSGVEIARLTLPLNPPASVTLMVVELDAPWLTETTAGVPRIQKPGTCWPARSSIRSCPLALPHPVARS